MAAEKADLAKRAAKVLRLPLRAQAVVDHYLNLQILGASTACPYHINCRLRSRNRALVGKGTPEEIERTAEAYFKRLHTNVYPGQSAQLKSSLQDYGIGIDCSGFASWVINEVTLARLGKPIWKCLRFPTARRQVISTFRPIENISAGLLTGTRNADTVASIVAVRPGDFIRGLGGNHVIVVTEVGVDKKGNAQYFRYAHSSTGYQGDSGVRMGFAQITHPEGTLLDQAWTEDCPGEPAALRSVKFDVSESRIVRLKVLASYGL